MGRLYPKYRKNFRDFNDHLLFFKVLAFIIAFPAIKWLFRKRPLQEFLEFFTPETTRPRGKSRQVHVFADWILNWNVLWIKPMCLIKCLIIFRFWRLEGIEAVIKFGVMMPGDELKSHCWLEVDRVPVVGDSGNMYKDIYTYPPKANDLKGTSPSGATAES